MKTESSTVPTSYSVEAFNYADESENRIHADDTAREYGFRGGLVPGVGDYAYLTRVAADTWGSEWLERGWMEAKFLKPVYDGDRVTASGQAADEGRRIDLELHDSKGRLCAVGAAGLDPRREAPSPDRFRRAPVPETDARPPASLETLAIGTILGTVTLDHGELGEEIGASVGRFRDEAALYRPGANGAVLHPALVPDLGNRLLTSNVRLGPWIHTATQAQHFAPVRSDRPLEVRGHVSEAFEKRGHEIVVLEVALFDTDERCLGHLFHTAIIRPRKAVAAQPDARHLGR